MILILSLLLFVIFTTLRLIHFNWVIGGKWGFKKTIPTKENGESVDSGVVGLALCSFGVFYLLKSSVLNINIPSWITTYGSWIIPSIFILRAIGDFKYIGFLKKNKEYHIWKSLFKNIFPVVFNDRNVNTVD
jgi:hypothetical protein